VLRHDADSLGQELLAELFPDQQEHLPVGETVPPDVLAAGEDMLLVGEVIRQGGEMVEHLLHEVARDPRGRLVVQVFLHQIDEGDQRPAQSPLRVPLDHREVLLHQGRKRRVQEETDRLFAFSRFTDPCIDS
jgi:hypothetical protein